MFLCLQVPTNPIAHQVFCLFVRVCLSFVYHSGNGDPPAIALILIKVSCVTKSECVFLLCMLCLITKGVVVDSFSAAPAWLWLLFRVIKLPQCTKNIT